MHGGNRITPLSSSRGKPKGLRKYDSTLIRDVTMQGADQNLFNPARHVATHGLEGDQMRFGFTRHMVTLGGGANTTLLLRVTWQRMSMKHIILPYSSHGDAGDGNT